MGIRSGSSNIFPLLQTIEIGFPFRSRCFIIQRDSVRADQNIIRDPLRIHIKLLLQSRVLC